jgi:hypothetical protein
MPMIHSLGYLYRPRPDISTYELREQRVPLSVFFSGAL